MKTRSNWTSQGPESTPITHSSRPSTVPFRDESLNANLEDAQEKFDIWKEDYNNYRPHNQKYMFKFMFSGSNTQIICKEEINENIKGFIAN